VSKGRLKLPSITVCIHPLNSKRGLTDHLAMSSDHGHGRKHFHPRQWISRGLMERAAALGVDLAVCCGGTPVTVALQGVSIGARPRRAAPLPSPVVEPNVFHGLTARACITFGGFGPTADRAVCPVSSFVATGSSTLDAKAFRTTASIPIRPSRTILTGILPTRPIQLWGQHFESSAAVGARDGKLGKTTNAFIAASEPPVFAAGASDNRGDFSSGHWSYYCRVSACLFYTSYSGLWNKT
jgi:hypothetical protein